MRSGGSTCSIDRAFRAPLPSAFAFGPVALHSMDLPNPALTRWAHTNAAPAGLGSSGDRVICDRVIWRSEVIRLSDSNGSMARSPDDPIYLGGSCGWSSLSGSPLG